MKKWLSFHNRWFVCVLLSGSALAAYFHTLRAPFHFDDIVLLLGDPRIRNVSLAVQGWGVDTRKALTLLSFALNYALHGENTFGYHAVNLGLHIGTGLLLYHVFRKLFAAPRADAGLFQDAKALSVFASLIFLLHPLQTQSVTYIWERSEVLSGFFYTLILWSYLKARVERKRRFYLYSALFYFIGMYAKGTVVTAPLLILLIEILLWRDVGTRLSSFLGFFRSRREKVLAGILIVLSGFVLYRPISMVLFGVVPSFYDTYFFTQFPIIWKYIRLTLIPVGLSLEHSYRWIHTFWDPAVLTGAAGLLLILAALIRYAQRFPLIVLGVGWYFIYLLPTSLNSIATPVFEHRLYFSIAGFGLAVTVFLLRVVRDSCRFRLVMIVIVAAFFSLTCFRNTVWMSRITLLEDTVQKNPDLPRPLSALGALYLKAGSIDKAEQLFKKAVSLSPGFADPHNNLGLIYLNRGEYKLAEKEFLAAHHHDPSYFGPYLNLGSLYQKAGRPVLALQWYRRGFEEIQNEKLCLSYARSLISFKRYPQAERVLNRCRAIDPASPDIPLLRGRMALGRGSPEQAVEYYRRAIRQDPEGWEAYNDLGVVYFQLKDWEAARHFLEKARRCNPDRRGIYKNLANVYHELKQYKKAERYYDFYRTLPYRKGQNIQKE
ncbi:MAG: tetratricopeptide repeat protein [Candidatus Omnitrophota bacterium]